MCIRDRLSGLRDLAAQILGKLVRLGGPPRLNEAGEMEGGHLYWEKQGPID